MESRCSEREMEREGAREGKGGGWKREKGKGKEVGGERAYLRGTTRGKKREN